MRHLKQKHNIAAQKRQKTSGVSEVIGEIPDINTDCIFDCEASQQSCNSDLLNELEGEDDREDSNLLEKDKFMDTDLDPNTPGDEGDIYDDLTQRDQEHK